MPRSWNKWLTWLLTAALAVYAVLVVVDLAGGPDMPGWASTAIFAAILLWFIVPELRQPQTGRMRALLWFTGACAGLLIVGTAVELVVA